MKTTINSVLEEFDKEFLPLASTQGPDAPSHCAWHQHAKFQAFLRSAISKTCDEILGSVPEKGNRLCRGHHKCKREGEHYHTGPEELAWNRCRQAIESKIRELKGEVEIREIVAGKGRKK